MDANLPFLLFGLVISVVVALIVFFVYRQAVKSDQAQSLPATETIAIDKADPTAVVPIHTPDQIQRHELKPLAQALSQTRLGILGRLRSAFSTRQVLTAEQLEEIEEILYTSDLGPKTVQHLLTTLQEKMDGSGAENFERIRGFLREEMMAIFANGHDSSASNGHHREPGERPYLEGIEDLNIWDHKPAVVLIVGVNGAGKTTTIGKLARRLAQTGRKVMVAAGDTFRAAAGEQLKIWTERAAVEIFSPDNVNDPAAVAFSACQAAASGAFDVVLIDTAGRLHTQKNLMEELKKVKRVIGKPVEGAPHETLLVLDANSGQNALQQAREFHSSLEVTGVVLTKLDGTAKGGVAFGLAHELRLPIKLIGVGEGIEDLRGFSYREFVESIMNETANDPQKDQFLDRIH